MSEWVQRKFNRSTYRNVARFDRASEASRVLDRRLDRNEANLESQLNAYALIWPQR